MTIKQHKIIRALYDDQSITIYQAYHSAIADAALQAQTLVAPFKMTRMTWIKPSFLWMMYRSGWATKLGQERILAIKMKRSGFDWLLANSCLSTFNQNTYSTVEQWQQRLMNTSVRIQWDPEKNLHLQNLDYKSIQIGLKGAAVEHYVSDWILAIDDITKRCHVMSDLVTQGQLEQAKALLPAEKIYPLSPQITAIIDASE